MDIVTHSSVLSVSRRRLAFVALVTAGIAILLAGVAMACVPWRGEMTVTPVDQDGNDRTGNGRTAVTVHGANSGGMSWCTGDSYPAAVVDPLGFVEVKVKESTKCNENNDQPQKPNKLNAYDEYIVSITEGGFVNPDENGEYSGWVGDCMSIVLGEDGRGIDVGTPTQQFSQPLVVGANGKGSGVYGPLRLLSQSATPQEAGGICVTGTPNGERQGNMAPITTL